MIMVGLRRRFSVGLILASLAAAASPVAGADFNLAERLHLQQALVAKGFSINGANGTFGPRTRAAIEAYQASLGHPVSGALTDSEAERLLDGYAPPQGFEILENADLPENDYRMGIGRNADPALDDIDLAACEAACASEAQCQAFTYNVAARVCFLKTSGDSPAHFDGAISGRRVGASGVVSVASTSPTGQQIGLFEVLEGVDLPGNDIRVNGRLGVGTYSPMRCEEICEATSGCTAYTYNSSARVCFPKTSASRPIAFASATSGRLDGSSVSTGGWHTDSKAILVWVRSALSAVPVGVAADIEQKMQGRDGYHPLVNEDLSGTERNYAIARQISWVLEDRHYDSRAGMDVAISLLGDLYRYGMFDVADDLTAAVADSEIFMMGLWNNYHSPGSAAWVVANTALGSRDYALAELALTHALENTPLNSNNRFRIELLRMLMQARDEGGNYAGAVAVAQEATTMIRSGLVAVDDGLGKSFADMAKSGGSPSQRTATRLASLGDDFAAALEAACGAAGALPPPIPPELLDRDQASEAAFMAVAPRYAECAHARFADKGLTNYPLMTTAFVQAFASDYVRVLAALDEEATMDALITEMIRQTNLAATIGDADLEALVSTDEGSHLTPAKRMEFARKALLDTRFNWAVSIVRSLHALGKIETARRYLERIVNELDDDVLRALLEGSGTKVFLAEVYALQGPEPFLRFLAHVPPIAAGDHCRWEACEIEILRARAEGRLDDIAEQQSWLEVAYVVAWSGAGADATEMDSIKESAIEEATNYVRLGLFDIADGYFRIAEVTPDAILADETPIGALDDLEAADAYIETLVFRGDIATANQLARHIVSATRDRAETGATFSDDSVMRWASRLDGIFRNYLTTLPWSESGELTHDEDLALFAMQFLQMTPTATTFTQLGARMLGSNSELIKAQQDLGRRLSDAYGDLSVASADTNALLNEIKGLEAERTALEARLTSEEPQYASYARYNFATGTSVAGVLEPGEAVWVGLLNEDALYLAWIDGGDMELRRQTAGPDYAQLVTRYRRAMTVSPELPPLPIADGYALYNALLGPFEARRADVDRLILVPSGVLDAVPFAALPTIAPIQDELTPAELLHSPQRWLIRDVALASLPSLSSFEILRAVSVQAAPARPFFGLGDPAYGARDGVTLQPLPETGAEVRFLAALLGAQEADLLIGQDANEPTLNDIELGQYRVLDFATHGFIAGGIPGLDEPALALAESADSDGLLTASEILGWTLNADMVILSACNTAASDGTPGAEGLSGLANSFFYAGARNLTVTHWSIPSGPAVDVVANMIMAYQEQPELGYATALRNSVLGMIEAPSSELNAHPVSWAGQFVVGAN